MSTVKSKTPSVTHVMAQRVVRRAWKLYADYEQSKNGLLRDSYVQARAFAVQALRDNPKWQEEMPLPPIVSQ